MNISVNLKKEKKTFIDENAISVTWQEVAMPGEWVVGADITVHHSHHCDLWVIGDWFWCFNLHKHYWKDHQQEWKYREN